PSVGATRTAQRMSLAITPFEAGAEESYAGAGLAESLFRRFASLDSVDVVARKTSPRELSLAEVGARNVLRGKVTRRGGDLEVEAEIVAVPGGRRLWSERYVAPASDLLTLDHRLSSDVEKFLGGSTAKAPQQARSSTVDPDAYREYLKGRYYWNKFSVEGFRTALGHFQASIDEDPTFALAWAGLADTDLMLGFYDDDGDENMPKARAAAERAVTLDSQLGEGWTSLGSVLYLHDWKWRQAEDALRRGVELNPRYTTSHHSYAVYLALVGRFDEALAEINRASELDPLAIVIYVDMAWIQYCAGQQEAGLKTIDKAVRHDPKSPLAHYERSWHLDRLGRYEEAIADLETALALEKKETSSAQKLRNALRRGGKQGYFLQRLELAASGESPHVNRSMLYVWLGDHQSALSELESALAARERDLVYVKTSGALAPLRQYARFQKILDEIGFPE
ncbi:MAG TPA: tetratricopeptide repeat protein, partial [Thermoanaerobaculia bacterium]